MKHHPGSILFSLIFVFLAISSSGQHIFSEKELAYKKTFLPYDVPYTFALEDKQFVMLSEVKKNFMKLGRYDQYFFEQWEKQIQFNADESAPQVFLKGDSLITYSSTIISDKNQIRHSFRYFDIKNGEEFLPTNYTLSMIATEGYTPKVFFSQDKSKFLIYNYLVNHEGSDKVEFQVFNLGSETPLHVYHLDTRILTTSKANKAHLSNNGDVLLVLIEPTNFEMVSYFWGINNKEANKLSNSFFFERPVDRIGEIGIIRQSASSYFVSFTANIEEELIGFNVTGFNVVLKTIMYSHNQNLRKEEIESLYQKYTTTSQKQKKKYLEIPETLEDYRLVYSFVNHQNDIILFIENLEISIDFHEYTSHENIPWKHKSKVDKFYFGGDILMYCFSESGELKWKHTIQKTQFSQASGLGLSFIPRIENNDLDLFMYESSKGGNFYILKINTLDGSIKKSTNLLPEDKFEFTKKYSCWLSENAFLICGISPVNINKRTLMLVEF